MKRSLNKLGIPHKGFNDVELGVALTNAHLERGASIVEAASILMKEFNGAFSCTALIKEPDGEPVFMACRDELGIRPLSFGKTKKDGYVVASETYALDVMGATFVRDVKPGELIIFRKNELISHQIAESNPKFDIFELIYFSNPDSLFYGQRIGDIRKTMAYQLAVEYAERKSVDRHSLVIGIPKSGELYAESFAEALGLEYKSAITKDERLGRSFMEPTQELREQLRDRKYQFDQQLIAGRDIIAIDDSMVRNTTAPYITKRLRECGAKSVSILLASPPIRYPNFYGIDTPEQRDLAAARYTMKEIKRKINCNRLAFLSLKGLKQSVKTATGQDADSFELSCFTGQYDIPIGERQIQLPVCGEDDIAA